MVNQRGSVRLRDAFRDRDERVDRTLFARRFLFDVDDRVARSDRLGGFRLAEVLRFLRWPDERRALADRAEVEARRLLELGVDLRVADERRFVALEEPLREPDFVLLDEVRRELRVVSVAVIACSQFLCLLE